MTHHDGIGIIGDFVLDVSDLDRSAEFWSQVLGVEAVHRLEPFLWLGSQVEAAPNLVLQRVPEPKTVKNRAHLDVHVGDVEAAVARVEELGGSRVREVVEPGYRLWVMADPDGNEFCLVPRTGA